MLIRLSCARRVSLILFVMGCGTQDAFAGPVDRIEPPFWWQGFEHEELQIMIHGHGTGRFDIAVEYPGVTVNRVERVESGNYLFLYLDIDATVEPGKFDIVLEDGDIRVAHEYELKQRSTDPKHTKGFSPADAIYLVTPDRFANGDPSNDSVEGLSERLDRDNNYGRHGGDLAGLRNSLDYIDDMGFTAIWLNPILENAMPELNQRNPLLADYLIQNAIWWVEYLGPTGIRLDTYGFSDKDFLSDWTRRIMQEFPNFNITGEETLENPALLSYWQRGKQNFDGYVSWLPSLLDFPLYHAMNKSLTKEVAWWDSPWTDAYRTLGTDFEYPDPMNLVIFPDNHDQSRIYTKVGENYDLFRMAMAYYLTMRGIPQIYYGTEVLMSHPRDDGNHGEIRAEFPGGWDDHEKNAFTGEGLTDDERRAQILLRKLLNWRKEKPLINSGKLMQFTPIQYVYAYFRYNETETVMVVFNRGEEPVTLDMDRFGERIGDRTHATDVITGKYVNIESSVDLAPMSVMILEVE